MSARQIPRTGFTLIELLIVVAIIAILAAIAVPNFLEAQVRAKVSRAKNDLRTIATGLEAYAVDTNKYPWSNNSSRAFCPVDEINDGYKPTLERLTTPVAYLTGTSSFQDPFKANGTYRNTDLEEMRPIERYDNQFDNFQLYWYVARRMNQVVWDQRNEVDPSWWLLESCGPDRKHHNWGTYVNTYARNDDAAGLAAVMKMIYDPTNGTVSRGSIWRVGGEKMGTGQPLYRAVTQAQK
jgi:prepilin-type N-terminal cleavage/methylation domain-containing protein